MLMPRKTKFRKQQRGRRRGVAKGQQQVHFGDYGLKSLDAAVSQKPAETRMGSGKGSPEHWVAVVKPGRVMFELSGVPEPLAREAMRLAGMKLPVKTKFVKREADLFEG